MKARMSLVSEWTLFMVPPAPALAPLPLPPLPALMRTLCARMLSSWMIKILLTSAPRPPDLPSEPSPATTCRSKPSSVAFDTLPPFAPMLSPTVVPPSPPSTRMSESNVCTSLRRSTLFTEPPEPARPSAGPRFAPPRPPLTAISSPFTSGVCTRTRIVSAVPPAPPIFPSPPAPPLITTLSASRSPELMSPPLLSSKPT